jgi:ABC-type branched-subunit amino acid transport system ATPase component
MVVLTTCRAESAGTHHYTNAERGSRASIKSNNQNGMTILVVEPNAHMALEIAGRGHVRETGKFVLHDASASLVAHERMKQAYLGGKGR